VVSLSRLRASPLRRITRGAGACSRLASGNRRGPRRARSFRARSSPTAGRSGLRAEAPARGPAYALTASGRTSAPLRPFDASTVSSRPAVMSSCRIATDRTGLSVQWHSATSAPASRKARRHLNGVKTGKMSASSPASRGPFQVPSCGRYRPAFSGSVQKILQHSGSEAKALSSPNARGSRWRSRQRSLGAARAMPRIGLWIDEPATRLAWPRQSAGWPRPRPFTARKALPVRRCHPWPALMPCRAICVGSRGFLDDLARAFPQAWPW